MEPIGTSGEAVDPRVAWARRDFLRLAAAAGLVGAAGAGCRNVRWGGALTEPAPEPSPLGPETLAKGLVAMSVAHHRGWVSGHGGAAVVAAHYFCVDNRLDARTTRALEANVDAFIEKRPDGFPTGDPGPGAADPASIVEQLDGHVTDLRGGGHNVIYASLALRALQDRPDLSTPSIVDGVRRLLEAHASDRRPVPDTPYNQEHPLPPYESAADVAAITLRATLGPWNHVRAIGTSGVIHWITHAEALVTLEDLGYGDLARRGYAAHRLHVNGRAPEQGGCPPERPAVEWLGPEYWESEAPRRLFGGSWLAGHAFKLPYSLFRLLRRVDDESLRSASLERATALTVPFE